jgi:hypothetical protein
MGEIAGGNEKKLLPTSFSRFAWAGDEAGLRPPGPLDATAIT